MSYRQALLYCGVKLKYFKVFGSHRGDWIAVTEDNRYMSGFKGTCEICDAFKCEFGFDYTSPLELIDGKYYEDNNPFNEELTESQAIDFNKRLDIRLKSFVKQYIDVAESRKEIIARYERKRVEEDNGDEEEIIEWLKTT